jgi:hypothetical protein
MLSCDRRRKQDQTVSDHYVAGEPIADLIPAVAKVKRKEWLGSMKGTFEIVGDMMVLSLT